ncbi:MAG: sulfatase-like hydrolase/transferase, partial [Verrucomicrobia bacterium]|nr:sulfatase-like hydrolase/transferase [Verrucomicrobiota bacterium]
ATEAIKRLQAFKQSGSPFFLALGFIKPHLPFNAPRKYWDMYQRSDFKVAPNQKLPEGAPSYAGHDSGELHAYADIAKGNPIPETKQLELLHGYHAAISYMDAQLGRVLDELEALKLSDNTIIVLWGDHGWHLGDHGIWCKHSNFEQATRVPLIISAPKQATAGGKSDAVVEFVDIYPTICDLAGLPKPEHLQGASLKPLMDGSAKTVADNTAYHVYPRSQKGAGELLGQTLRTPRYRLVEWQKADKSVTARELYDYELDAEETVNLADKPEHAALVAELSKQLNTHLNAPPPKGVTLQDRKKAAPAPKAKEPLTVEKRLKMFQECDLNQDGQLTREEFIGKRKDLGQAKKSFEQRDIDQSGTLSKAEYAPLAPLKPSSGKK